jgi:hypothetical protein
MASSTTTSSTTDSSSQEETQPETIVPEKPKNEKFKAKKPSLKRQRPEHELSQSTQAQDEAALTQDSNGHMDPPPKKKRKIRKLEVPPFTGYLLHIQGVDRKIIESTRNEFDDPIVKAAFPDSKCEIVEAKYVKRLPTDEEKHEWQLETKRLSKERLKAEGHKKREMTEEEKRLRKERNSNPEYIARKKEMARIKREVFLANQENIKKYKDLVKQKFGEQKRKKRVKKDVAMEEEK